MPYALTDDRLVNQVLTLVELGYNNEATPTPAIAWLELDSRAVTFEETTSTLTTEGTTQTWEKESVDRSTVTVENQVYQRALNKAFIGDPTTTGMTGVAERYGYTGDTPGRIFALRLTYKATDPDTGADVVLAQTYHKVSARRYTPRESVTRKAVPTQRVALTATKTTTDILGATVPGSGSGVFFTEDKLV